MEGFHYFSSSETEKREEAKEFFLWPLLCIENGSATMVYFCRFSAQKQFKNQLKHVSQ